jgi:tight adherence protein C
MIYLIVISVFVAILILTAALLYPMLAKRSLAVERLEKLASSQVTKLDTASDEHPKVKDFFKRLGGSMPVSPGDQTKYTKMLVAAGFKKDSVYVFLGSKLFLACALPALYISYLLFFKLREGTLADAFTQPQTMLIVVVLAIVGFLLPSYWLHYKLKNRQMKIFHTLPDILDLITVCVESGLSMDAALIRSTETPQFSKDPLALEIRTATREARAGKPRTEALKDMAERTMVDDVKAFVTMLAQTERFGTSLSQALRVHAESLRTKRRQIAEEAAAKTTVKLLFPLIFFIFPALLVVILGPAFIRITEFLK